MAGAGPRFVDEGERWGLNHRNLAGPTPEVGKLYLRDTIGAGIAVLDADGDGRLDLYFPQGTDGTPEGGDSADRLYLNRGDGTLEERGAELGLADRGYGFGALAFDFDADGDDDLLLTRLGTNVLFRNDAGHFVDVTAEHPGLAGDEHEWGTGASAGDVDGDGDLDLYVANYCAQDLAHLDERGLCLFMNCRVPCGPNGLPPQADHFYRNSGAPDWRLAEATAGTGLDAVEPSYGFQPSFVDVDDDGDLDLYVTNDSVFNFLFVNDGSGAFEEFALPAGVACSRRGQMEAGMGLAVADLDGDGLPEFHVTNFSNQSNSLYRNLTTDADLPWFEEVGEELGCGRPSWFRLAWGTSFGDFDADGRLDLFVANGHIYHHVTGCAPERVVYRQENDLFRGGDDGRFEQWAARAGAPFTQTASHRGSVMVDLDDDGRLDLVVNRLDEAPLLAHNDSPEHGHWITLDVRRQEWPERAASRAVGVRAVVTAGGRRFVRDLVCGSSFLGTEDPRLHFGLGQSVVSGGGPGSGGPGPTTTIDDLTLRLPGRAPVSLGPLPVDRIVQVRLGPGDAVDVRLDGN